LYNERFTLSNGTEIFPNYMNAEKRSILKEQIGDRSEVMWCSCRTDKKLFYRISENLRFYPEHNGYEHMPLCIRFHTEESKRKTAIVRTDEETATVYLQFNPKNFTIPTTNPTDDESDDNLEEEISFSDSLSSNPSVENEILHLNRLKVDSDKYREPKFNLATFIRCINHDTFTERTINNKSILSCDYFTNALFGRLKNIRISGMKKSVRSLSLEDDGVRFFYSPFLGCDIKKSPASISYHVLIKSYENKVYPLFTFGSIYEKALKRFHKQYGIEPNDYTMVAGFQYYPTSKGGTNYKVIGRLHLFQVSEHGIYCSSLFEQECLNKIVNYVKKQRTINARFYIPADDDLINGIVELEGYHKKGIIIFPSTRESKELTIDKGIFEPLLLEPDNVLTDNTLNTFFNRIKSN
jgi:hypothetical protein